MIRWLILVCIQIIITQYVSFGQDDQLEELDSVLVSAEKSVIIDTLIDFGEEDYRTYQYQEISDSIIQDYLENKDFNYKRNGDQNQVKQNFNFLEAFFNSLIELLERLFNFNMPSGIATFIKFIFYFLGLGLVIFIISQISGVKLNFKKKTKPKLEELSFETIEENLEEINFDDLLEQAIKEGRYRIAIRLFFLKNLQQLSKKENIRWSIDKTNNDYKYELASTPLINGFNQTVYLFEYIWYGNFDLTDLEFQQALNTFRKFQNQIVHE